MLTQQKQGKNRTAERQLMPAIPDKIYFTIGEVAYLCKLRPHVLRYWEQEFSELSPAKRRGNRRYYRREDILLIRKIRDLLYDQGYTIEGARGQLKALSCREFKIDHKAINDVILELEAVVASLNASEII